MRRPADHSSRIRARQLHAAACRRDLSGTEHRSGDVGAVERVPGRTAAPLARSWTDVRHADPLSPSLPHGPALTIAAQCQGGRAVGRQQADSSRSCGRSRRATTSSSWMNRPLRSVPPSARRLYDLVGRLRAEGTVSIIFISHDLDEVLRLCDRVSVMRDGRLLETRPGPQWTKQALGEPRCSAKSKSSTGARPLAARQHRTAARRNLAAAGWVSGVSFTLHQGEILGIAGLVGAGRTEILRAIAGAESARPWPHDVGGRRHRVAAQRARGNRPRHRSGAGRTQDARDWCWDATAPPTSL